MNILSTIGYKRLYHQFIRPTMEYALALTVTIKQIQRKLESTQEHRNHADVDQPLRNPMRSDADPISFLLNPLPSNPPRSPITINRWKRTWPRLWTIFLALEYLQHPEHEEPPLTWITRFDSPPPRID
ncbi:unnamed protein product [Absidia cylindrospora]